jgi:putative hydrolase of the HAD superfamily
MLKDPLAYTVYLFDMGNVVIRDITTIEAISAHYDIDLEALRVDYEHYAFPLMDGTIDSALYWRHVKHQFGVQVEGDPLATFFKPTWNTPVVRIISELRARGKRVVCGSNTYAPHWQLLKRQGYLDVFDAAYASHELGISKPATQFFSTILAKERVDTDSVLFIDDYEENIVAARSIGIDAILYQFDQPLLSYFSSLIEK